MSCKEREHEADSLSSICAHVETKCEAVEIDLLDCLLIRDKLPHVPLFDCINVHSGRKSARQIDVPS